MKQESFIAIFMTLRSHLQIMQQIPKFALSLFYKIQIFFYNYYQQKCHNLFILVISGGRRNKNVIFKCIVSTMTSCLSSFFFNQVGANIQRGRSRPTRCHIYLSPIEFFATIELDFKIFETISCAEYIFAKSPSDSSLVQARPTLQYFGSSICILTSIED